MIDGGLIVSNSPGSGGLKLVTSGPGTQPPTIVYTPTVATVMYGIAMSFQGASIGWKFKVTDNGVQHNLPNNGGFDPGMVNSTNGTEPETHAFFWSETVALIQHTVALNLFIKYGNPTNSEVEFFVFYQ